METSFQTGLNKKVEINDEKSIEEANKVLEARTVEIVLEFQKEIEQMEVVEEVSK